MNDYLILILTLFKSLEALRWLIASIYPLYKKITAKETTITPPNIKMYSAFP